MAKSKKGTVLELDVSGDRTDFRGKPINTDVPEESRRSGSTSSSNAKKRLKQKKEQAEKRRQEILEETKPEKPGRKKKKDKYSLDVDKKAKEKPKKEKSKKEKEEPKKKKKRKKKTTGELLSEGKTEQARRKMNKLASNLPAVVSEEGMEGYVVQNTINSEAEFLQEYYHIYATLGSIIRNLEQKMTSPDSEVNSKDVYALMTMYSQMRETIADLRSIKDMNEQAEELAEAVFDPAAKSAGESLVSIYYKVTSSVRQKVDDPAVVQAILETLKRDVADSATALQDQFNVARGRIVEILNGGS